MGSRPSRRPSYDDPRERGRLQLWPPSRNTVLAAVGIVVAAYVIVSSVYVGNTRGQQALRLTSNLQATALNFSALAGGASCDDLLLIPKVALMFLTPGKLAHERLWREWLEQSVGLLPTPSVIQYAQGSFGLRAEKLREVQAACLPPVLDRTRSVTERQYLFTVYVHTHPAFRGYRNFSMFHNKIIPNRIVAKRGHHSLTDAERLLLVEALKEPLNQQFLLISETSVPMYPSPLIWEQILHEGVSRMDACNYKTDLIGNLERWNDKMETSNFKKHHWRKTSQWFSCTRKHAQIIVDDTEVNDAFEKFCFPYHDHVRRRNVSCSSNEHYTAIVLAVAGLAHETTCYGGGTTHVDWSKMNNEGRPRSFRKREIRDRLILHARSRQCTMDEIDAALHAASRRFVPVAALPVSGMFPRLAAPDYPAINANCSIFIRKFPAETAAVAREALRKFLRMPIEL